MKLQVFFLVLAVQLFFACASSKQEINSEEQREKAFTGYNQLEKEPGAAMPAAHSNSLLQNASQAEQKELLKPVIMVLPASSDGENTEEAITGNPFSQMTFDALNNYLSGKGYEIKTILGMSAIDDLVQMQSEIESDEDVSYIASLSLGADVYLKYAFRIVGNMVTVDLNAYETSTARLLGSASGNVKNNGVKVENLSYLVQSAAKKAMMSLEKSLLAYWNEDLKNGTQYKLILKTKIAEKAGASEDLQERILAALRSAFKQVRVNKMTAQTMDLTLYANPMALQDSYAVYSLIKESLLSVTAVKKNNISQKLLIIETE